MSTRRLGAVGIGLACLAALAPAAVAAPHQDVAAADPTPFLGTEWYGAYIQGKKAGFAQMTLRKAEHEGRPSVEVVFEGTFRLTAGGSRIEMKMAQRQVYAAGAPQHLLAFSMRQSQGPMRVERSGERRGEELVVKSAENGRAMPEQTVPAPRET
ncbi:MAG: hypothetical protein L0216_20855, partial [Planctomycetales bacterium]|nr:hypothetical protein [Planctomycetales bacterium]